MKTLIVAKLVSEITTFHGTPKIRYSAHSIPPLVPILSQLNPVHTLTSYLFKVQFNSILLFMSRSRKLSLPFMIKSG
jgi:hypothetical protein